jgi:hypothetical protein
MRLSNNSIQKEMDDYFEISDEKLFDLRLDPKAVKKLYDVIDTPEGLYLVTKNISRRAWIPHAKMMQVLAEGELLGLFESKRNKGYIVFELVSPQECYGSSPSEGLISNFLYASHRDDPYEKSHSHGESVIELEEKRDPLNVAGFMKKHRL